MSVCNEILGRFAQKIFLSHKFRVIMALSFDCNNYNMPLWITTKIALESLRYSSIREINAIPYFAVYYTHFFHSKNDFGSPVRVMYRNTKIWDFFCYYCISLTALNRCLCPRGTLYLL